MMYLFIASILCFGLGVLAVLLSVRSPKPCRVAAHSFALAGSLGMLIFGFAGLQGAGFESKLPSVMPGAGLQFTIDRLSAFFIVVIAVGAVAAALYAFGYTRQYTGHRVAGAGVSLNVFLPSMFCVVLAANALTFLFFWELMALASYFLVMTESEHADTREAGWIYFVMTHAGFACLLIAFLVLSAAADSTDFANWPRASLLMDARPRNLAFILLAIGFGSKAGLIPFHIWLPRAHPAAPSHVSALMSGVMIKLGIYGLIRTVFVWMGAGPEWWGILILLFAAMSSVLGVLYALVENDLKRLLAYSSVENIGIITLGIGAAMLFQAFHLPGLAGLALIAALYHTINHAIFKSLLFMGAGAVLHAAHTRNMEEMGGLIRRMPQTAALFLVGSVAIAALPPFNGLASEWLTFQSLLLSFQIPARTVNLVFAVSVAALALTGGLAAACFVKAFGISFLALPRSKHAEDARECDWTMRAAMGVLAILCLVFGVAPFMVVSYLKDAAAELTGAAPDLAFNWTTLAAGSGFATFSPPWVLAGLVLLPVLVLGLLLAAGANRKSRKYETWGCGRAVQGARFEYTAAAFSNPFTRVFAFLYQPVEETDVQSHPESRFFVHTILYKHETRSIFEEWFYIPVVRHVRAIANRARVLQSGNVHSYLLYIFLALLCLLVLINR